MYSGAITKIEFHIVRACGIYSMQYMYYTLSALSRSGYSVGSEAVEEEAKASLNPSELIQDESAYVRQRRMDYFMRSTHLLHTRHFTIF